MAWGTAAASTMPVSVAAASERPRLVNRDDWDAFHAKGSCPTPPPPRKWNYLPLVATGPIHNIITLVLWLPMGLVVFALSLALNLSAWVITYTCLGGAHRLGLRSTLPKSNVILRCATRRRTTRACTLR